MYEERFDIRSILAVLNRRRNVIFGVLGTALLLAVVFCLIRPVKYEGLVSVRVQYPKGPNDTGSIMPSEQLIQNQLSTYAEIAKSRAVVEPVIAALYADQIEKPLYEDVVEQIDAKPIRGTEVLTLSILEKSPERAQIAANLLLASFNAKMTEIVRVQGKESRIFIGDRMAEAKRELDKTEKAMVEYKTQNQTVAIMDQNRSFVERLANLQRLDADNQVALATALAKLRSPMNVPDTPVIQQLRGRLADLEIELVTLKKNHTEKHPKVVTLLAAMAESKAKLNSELARVARGEVNLVQTQKATIDRLSAKVESEMLTLPAKEQGLARRMLDYNVAQELYVMLAKRYEDARISEIMQPTNVQTVDVAALPVEHAKPRWKLTLAVALILGLFGGVSSAFVVEYFYKTIDTAEDVKRYLDQVVIGSIPNYSDMFEQKAFWLRFNKSEVPGLVKYAEAKSQEVS